MALGCLVMFVSWNTGKRAIAGQSDERWEDSSDGGGWRSPAASRAHGTACPHDKIVCLSFFSLNLTGQPCLLKMDSKRIDLVR